ncbi:MAG: TolC family protein [Odoribacter sp.]
MKKIYLVIGMVFGVSVLFAQTLSIEQYRSKVLEYNQDIQKYRQAVDGALYSLKSIQTGFFPKVDAAGNYSYQIETIEFFPGTDLKHHNYGVEAG